MVGVKKLLITSAVVLSLTTALTGCGTPAQQHLFEAFEKTASAEQNVPTAFDQLKQLEQKDQTAYDNILSKGDQDSANVQTLITNTAASLAERQTALDDVKQQLDTAKTQLDDSVKLLDKLKDDSLKQQAEKVVTSYTKRYEVYQTLYTRYGDWLKAEQAVYDTLKAEETQLKEIQTAVANRNQVFQEVEELKEQFNQYTVEFNQAKQAFYTAAGIEVAQVNPAGSAEESDTANQG